MVHKVVCTSALQFVQDVARKNNSDSFFVAELSKIDSLVKKWLINLPRVRPFYAVHCNSDPMLLRMLMEYPQIGLHCVIRQHLDVALEFAGNIRVLNKYSIFI
jgi:ornithine decarboxylase